MRVLLIATICSVLAWTAAAQPNIHQGARELSLHVSPDFEGAVGDMIFVRAGYGHFVRRGLEARGTFTYALLEDVGGEDSDYRTSEFAFAVEHHFDRGRDFIPYAGAGLGWRSTQFSNTQESGVVYGPRAGLKFFLADNVALDFEVIYSLSSGDVFVNDFERDNTDISSAIGLRVLFGR